MMKAILLGTAGLLLAFNISVAQNTFPATGNVGIGTNSPAYNLDVNGTANTGTLSINQRLVLAMPESNPERGPFNPIWMALRRGKKLWVDEEFARGTNGVRFYNNENEGVVVVTRESGVGLPNTSGYYMEIKSSEFTRNILGGFRQDFAGKLNGTFVHLFRAKVPVGYTLNAVSNSMGTGGGRHWLTNNVGTGKWEDYAYVIQYGNGGIISSSGYVHLVGTPPAAGNFLTWQLASSTTFDATWLNDGAGSNINADMLDSLHAADFVKNQVAEDQIASFRISGDGFIAGNMGIGTTDTKGYKLAVGGSMVTESIKVKLKTAWPDYVFAPEYKLPSLQEVAAHIKQHQHLPDMPSAKEVAAEGIDLGEMNRKLLQKVEELTLYLIGQQEEMAKQQQEILELKKMIKNP